MKNLKIKCLKKARKIKISKVLNVLQTLQLLKKTQLLLTYGFQFVVVVRVSDKTFMLLFYEMFIYF